MNVVWIGAMRWVVLTFLTSLLLCTQPSGDSLNFGNSTLLDDYANPLRDEEQDVVLIFVKEREFRYPRIKRGLTVPCLTCTVLNKKECCRKYSKCCDQNSGSVPQQGGQQVGQQQHHHQGPQGNANPPRKQTRPAIQGAPNAQMPQTNGNGRRQFLIRSGTCPALSRRNNAKLRAACVHRCYEDANCPVNAKCCPQPTMCCRQLLDNANCPAVLGPQTCTGCVTDQGCPGGTGCCPQAVNQGCCIIPCNRNRRPGVAANQPNGRPGVVINQPGANRPPGGVVTHTVYMASPDPDTITETLGDPQATRPAGGGAGNTVVTVSVPGESVVTVDGPPPPVVITVDQTVGGNGPIVTVDQTQFVDGPVVTVDQTQTLFGPVVTVDRTVEVTKNPADGGAVETVVVVEDPNGNNNNEEVVVVVVTAETLQEAASEVIVGSDEVEVRSGDGSAMTSGEDDSTATFQSSPPTVSSDGFLTQETLPAHVDSNSDFPDHDNTLDSYVEEEPDESTETFTETEDVEEDPEDVSEEPSATVSSDDHIVFVAEKDSSSADETDGSESDTPLLQGSLSSNIGSGSVDTPPLKFVTTVTVH